MSENLFLTFDFYVQFW